MVIQERATAGCSSINAQRGCVRMRKKNVGRFRPASVHAIEVVPRHGFDALSINARFFGNQLNELPEIIAHHITAVPMGDVEAALIVIKVEGVSPDVSYIRISSAVSRVHRRYGGDNDGP